MSRNKRQRLDGDFLEGSAHRDDNRSLKPRLTRACAECKKQKIRCETTPGQTSCVKCLRTSIECVPYNFAQKFIDEDASWKARMTADLEQLRADVDRLQHGQREKDGQTQHRGLQAPPGHMTSPNVAHNMSASNDVSNEVSPTNFLAEGPSATTDKDDTELIPVPMNHLYNLTDPHTSQLIRVDPIGVNGPDFISKGVISLQEAEYLYTYFRDQINPMLWNGLLCSHQTLKEARRSSTLLVATVLTVAALQIPGKEKSLKAVYDAFVALMRGSCLLRSQSFDDIRGLCIGAFYLTSLSWALCSRAVRVATEMNLHKCSLQLSRGSLESHERVRLWYALYVCDHQFALAYGRPPMMHEDAAVRNLDAFLSSKYTTDGDVRLAAQVHLFRILAEVYFKYGCDPDLELSEKDFEKLRSFNVSIEQWRVAYKLAPTETPRHSLASGKETALYYHLSRFQVCSLALRGISARNASRASSPGLSFDRRELANVAISAATSTLRLIVEEADLCRALVSMPIFTHAMIAVCSSFLLKMQVAFSMQGSTYGEEANVITIPRDLGRLGLAFHTEDALTLAEDLTRALDTLAENASRQHVARHILTGLRELLGRFSRDNDSGRVVYTKSGVRQQAAGTSQVQSNNGIPVSSADSRIVLQNNGVFNFELNPGLLSNDSNPFAGNPGENNQQDPFDFMGDLDWRFNDEFLWPIDGMESYC